MMEEGSAAGGGGGGGESELGKAAAAATSYVSGGGGRQRFEVELRPGETTIVSWKKLVKDANRVKVPPPPPPVPAAELSAIAAASPSLPVSNVVPSPPGQIAEDEANDAPPASRFSAVIEKIERLYMGKNSSDEEDLNDVPDDDEYDTEDSFIDDAELDEYFQIDNSAVKHDGFFVNRGKLERIEPTLVPSEQPKKRRRKDLAKSNGGIDDRHISNKQMKVNRKAAEGLVPSVDKNTSPSHFIPTPTVRIEDVKHQIQVSTSEACFSKKSADAKTSGEPSPSRGSNGEAIIMAKYNDKQKSGIVQSKNHDSKMKDGTDIAASSLRTSDKSSFMQPKSQSGRLPNNVEDLSQSVQRKEKNIIRERSDIKVPENSLQTVKNPLMARKEGSNVKSKSTMLEKAIRELEKIVAESRPPSMDIPDADMSSQAVKRRMPPEIKQKLAKVARLAQTSNGKISTELLNRLMSIVGHLIQLRTLKRNLKIMVNTGASAIEEKDARLRQLKKDVDEMVKMRVPLMKSKAIEQQAGASDDFQETSMKEREGIKKRCSMDDALEDKICDIYDVFVDGLDEDAAPQIRKLYAELAELWPKGFMDNRGIKNAICRSKERKKSQYNRHKDQEKMKRKKLLTQNTEGTTQLEVGSSAQQQYIPEKLVNIDSANSGSSSVNRPVPSTQEVTNAATKMPVPSVNGPNIDRPKQEKVKAISNNPIDNKMTEVPIKKKVKRKPEAQLGEAAHTRTDKLAPAQGGEKHKSSKPTTTSVHKIPQPVTVALPTQPPHLNTSAKLL